MKPIVWRILLVAGMLLVLSACGAQTEPMQEQETEWKIIGRSDLGNEALTEWFDSKERIHGVHAYMAGKGHAYLLLAAGERPTGGYDVELESVEEEANRILFKAVLREPEKDEQVTMALTYPTLLVEIHGPEDLIASGELLFEAQGRTDSGRFDSWDGERMGIRISGTPDEMPPVVFPLSEEAAGTVEGLVLEKGDEILFDLKVEGNSEIVVRLVKMGGRTLLEPESPGEKTDSGRIEAWDGVEIQIHVSGTPEEMEARAFLAGPEVAGELERGVLKEKDDILFKYKQDGDELPTMTQAVKLD